MSPLSSKETFITSLSPLTCPICQESYNLDHHPVQLSCRHVFGHICIMECAETDSEQANTCPLCREILFEAEIFSSEEEDEGGEYYDGDSDYYDGGGGYDYEEEGYGYELYYSESEEEYSEDGREDEEMEDADMDGAANPPTSLDCALRNLRI